MKRHSLSPPIAGAATRGVSNVRDLDFLANNSIEDQISQTGRDNDARIWFVRSSSLERKVSDRQRSLVQASNEPRRNRRTFFADVSMNLSEVALGRARKANFHTRR